MRIGIIGCAGRMGRALLREVLATDGLELVGGTVRAGHPAHGEDLGLLAGQTRLDLTADSDADALLRRCEAVVEFSTPSATVAHAQAAAVAGCAYVAGTTGLDSTEHEALARAARGVPIVWAANMSLGVNLLAILVEQATAALGTGWDVEIVEMHHRNKVDAPSGTALLLGHAAARGRGVRLEEVAERGRDGITGARREGRIGFAALRGGDVVGTHEVVIAGEGERLVLGHVATDRAIYARGALRAAKWTAGRAPGLYALTDVLGLAPPPA